MSHLELLPSNWIPLYTRDMMKIIREYEFKAADFFAYVEEELQKDIAQKRQTKQVIKISSGIRYDLKAENGTKLGEVEITKFEPDKCYAAKYSYMGNVEEITYTLEDTEKGCKITALAEFPNYDAQKHSRLYNFFDNFSKHRSLYVTLNKLAQSVTERKK